MINKLSLGIASYLKQADTERTPSIDVMKYSLYIILHSLFTIISIFVISLFLNEVSATLSCLVFFMGLRFFAGGYHLQSSTWCTILSVLFICAAPFFYLSESEVMIINIVSIIIIILLAPRNFKGYARIPEKYFPFMKLVSVLIGGCNFIWQSSTLGAILVLQTILLLMKEKGGE